MNNFLMKLRSFMAGRNGIDKLTYGLLVVYCIFAAVKVFLRAFYVPYIVVSILQYAFLGYIIYRIMSKNLQKRYRENAAFERFLTAWKPYFEHLKLRVQFIKTHRFRTCKHCGEFLRLKKVRGTRNIRCPRCGNDLKFHIIF
ncbi:MAG: hypothetical protein IJZ35_01165 [Clostridia bacterium]|nr:hypothetical protein [Clostridia bacterium]